MSSAEQPRLPQSSKSYRLVTVGFGILLAVLMLAFVIQQWKHTYHLVKPVKDYTDYLGAHGMKTDEPTTADVQSDVSLAGVAIFQVEVDGQPVWVCYFDPNDKQQTAELAKVKEKSSIKINGEERPVKVHGTMAIVGFEKHPDKEKLEKALDEFDEPPKK